MKIEFSKMAGVLCLVLFFGIASVFAGNVFVSENGIQAEYSSSFGNIGVTQNVSYDDGTKILVIEDGIIIFVDENVSGETNSSNWWNNSWGFRKDITITETSGTTLYNYSVLLNISYESEMQSDFGDLRFVLNSNKLSYFIENNNSNYAMVFVKIPQLSASLAATVEMYYNNSLAVSQSDITKTFLFADNLTTDLFANQPWHSTWTSTESGSANWIDTANNMIKQEAGYGNDDKIYIDFASSIPISSTNPIKLSYSGYFDGTNGNNYYQGSLGVTDGSAHNFLSKTVWLPKGTGNYGWYIGDEWGYTGNGNLPSGYSNTLSAELIIAPTTSTLYVDYNNGAGMNLIGSDTTSSITSVGGLMIQQSWSIKQYYDTLRISTYASSEPAVLFGVEQSQ